MISVSSRLGAILVYVRVLAEPEGSSLALKHLHFVPGSVLRSLVVLAGRLVVEDWSGAPSRVQGSWRKPLSCLSWRETEMLNSIWKVDRSKVKQRGVNRAGALGQPSAKWSQRASICE
jgi:hypothetical protein